MSVQFTAEHRQAVGFAVTCGCAPATEQAALLGSYDEAARAASDADLADVRSPLPGCVLPDICPHSPLLVEPFDPDGPVPDVDVNEANARRLLTVLGLHSTEEEAWGQLPADLFLGRVLVALAVAPQDPGAPWTHSGRHHGGGRAARHLQRRLLELHDLAQWCARNGRAIAWS
jgi:hypothetical protein